MVSGRIMSRRTARLFGQWISSVAPLPRLQLPPRRPPLGQNCRFPKRGAFFIGLLMGSLWNRMVGSTVFSRNRWMLSSFLMIYKDFSVPSWTRETPCRTLTPASYWPQLVVRRSGLRELPITGAAVRVLRNQKLLGAATSTTASTRQNGPSYFSKLLHTKWRDRMAR